jgi:hypothetical protein
MKEIVFIIFAILFAIIMFCSYLVKDYRNKIIYKGFLGRVQKLITFKKI